MERGLWGLSIPSESPSFFLLRRIPADPSPYRSISNLRIASVFRGVFAATIVEGSVCTINVAQVCVLLLRASGVFDAAEDRYPRLTQNVFDDGLAEAGSVIIKHEAVGFLVVAEFVQTIGI